jgi:high-affinity iron transporter
MLVVLAAGLAATAAGFLIQANLLPAWGNQLWDSSWLLKNSSIVGQAVHILTGYEARPAGMQLVFWGATFALLIAGMRLVAWRMRVQRSRKQPVSKGIISNNATPATHGA